MSAATNIGYQPVTPENMMPLEATRPSTFRTPRDLANHVVKHVLETRDERWHQVLPAELIASARKEHALGEPGKNFVTLARAYEIFVSEQLFDSCAQNRSHQHVCRWKWSVPDWKNPAKGQPASKLAVAQEIDGWPPEDKLFFSAAAFVRGEEMLRYKIITAYRPWPKLSGSAHRRKARERQRNRESITSAKSDRSA